MFKLLFQQIISHGPGMVFHVVNIIVMVLMPMVVIHVKESGLTLSKYFLYTFAESFESIFNSKIFKFKKWLLLPLKVINYMNGSHLRERPQANIPNNNVFFKKSLQTKVVENHNDLDLDLHGKRYLNLQSNSPKTWG